MYRFTQDAIDLNELRARLRNMSDADLTAFGKAARYMCSPMANLGKPPREPFVDSAKGSDCGVEDAEVGQERCGLKLRL